LLLTVWAKQKKQMFEIWREKRDVFQLIMFGIFGMAFCQLSYYVAVETSNAGTATVLQYTAPIIIMLYVSVRNKKVPQRIEMLALVLAVGGTFLLATHGNITNLAISTETLVWGLASAVAMALYNLIPGELMKKFGTFNVIGWGMLIGGIFLCVFIKPWHVIGMWDIYTVLAMAAVILVGTILSFTTYMEGVRLIGASKASLFASVEPVTATFMTVVFMGAAFQFVDFIGLAGILGAVLMLSLLKKE
jgi:drug/metabolite transporter (DMT)-like permease